MKYRVRVGVASNGICYAYWTWEHHTEVMLSKWQRKRCLDIGLMLVPSFITLLLLEERWSPTKSTQKTSL